MVLHKARCRLGWSLGNSHPCINPTQLQTTAVRLSFVVVDRVPCRIVQVPNSGGGGISGVMVNRPDKIGIADTAVFYVLKNGNGGNDVEDDWACLLAMFACHVWPSSATRRLT